MTIKSIVIGYDVITKFSVEGTGKGSVHLSGYYQPGPAEDDDLDEEDYDDYDDEDDDEDEDERGLTKEQYMKLLASKGGANGDDDDDDDEDEDEDDDDDDSDDDNNTCFTALTPALRTASPMWYLLRRASDPSSP